MQDTPRSEARQRVYAGLLVLGTGFLMIRAFMMVAGDTLDILIPWVGVLLVLELVLDVGAVVAGARWMMSGMRRHSSLALRFGAAAVVVHALRAFLFSLGRMEPWLNFDIRPELRAMYADRWTPEEASVAGIVAALGLLIAAVVWWNRRQSKRKLEAATSE